MAWSRARAVVDPVDHHQPDRGQQGDQGEEVGIGVGEPDPQVDVGGEADGEEVGAVDQAEVAELGPILGEDGGEARGQEQGDRDQGEQFAVAGAHFPAPPPAARRGAAGARVVAAAGLAPRPFRRNFGGAVVAEAGPAFDLLDQRSRVGARSQVVAGDRAPLPAGERRGLDRARVALLIEADPEREVIGEPAVERHPATPVGAEEPDLADPVCGAKDDRREDSNRRDRLDRPTQAPAPWPRPLLPFPGAPRGGLAADLVRGEALLPGAWTDQGGALGRLGRGGRVGEAEGDCGDVVAAPLVVGVVDQSPDPGV